MNATELTCEYAANPLGVDTPRPRFGWVLKSDRRAAMQSAYRIVVASSPEALAGDEGDKWDSGKVESDQSVNVEYAGAELHSAERCWWKVQVWGKDETTGRWSRPATFEMGLMSPSDWQGGWIGAAREISSPLLRREFALPGPVKRARVYISGLGWNELYLNGRRVGDNVLDPACTCYKKRVLYVVHDVTELLKAGPNAVGVMLGNGWFSEPWWERDVTVSREWYGMPEAKERFGGICPQLLVQMNVELADGRMVSVATDGQWKASPGPILWNDFFCGETYDARLEKPGWTEPGCDDADWAPAETKDAPGGRMVCQLMPPIQVVKTLRAAQFTCPQPGVYVYDMGQIFGGWVRVRLRGPAGEKVSISYSARILDTGLIDKRGYKENGAVDFYVLKGDPAGETYEPRFTYHGVRYVQIEGSPQPLTITDLDGRVVRSAVDFSGDFDCSDPVLNQVHRNVTWTLSNGLFGIPLDCLYREHWAWTDPATITGTLYPRKHMPLFWTKWLNDIADAQRANGSVPNICPDYRGDASDPAWGGNYPILVRYLHQHYGDERILRDHYEGMKRCVDYLTSIAEGQIVSKGYFGDHMIAGPQPGKEEFISSETPPPLVWTGYYYRGAYVVSVAARMLGRTDDADRYGALAAEVRKAFNAKWLNEQTHQYAAGSQTANLFPLALGIVPEAHRQAALDAVVADITDKHAGHLHTGNTGTTCMIDVLPAQARGDVMCQVATQTTYPGWGYMVQQGATTIWESWSLIAGCGNAESMIMWATIDGFFYSGIAGITGPDYYGPQYMTPGYKDILLLPRVVGDLKHARASIKTVRGRVSSTWHRWGNVLVFPISIPANSRATVRLPKLGMEKITIAETLRPVWKDGRYQPGIEGVSGGKDLGDCIEFRIGSGDYTFRLEGTPPGEAKK